MNVDSDYYSTHQFHKLTNKFKDKNKLPFSIYHTNTEFLQCNFDRLHTQFVDLNYPFDIIVLSEVWNPSYKIDRFKLGIIEGYKRYNGTLGTTLKSGCGFYVKSTLHTRDRKDLDILYP